MKALLCALLLAFAMPALLSAASAQAPAECSTTVGLPGRIEELVLPGSELEPAPADAKAKVRVRILASSPHGSARRYDLEYTGFEAGELDLAPALRRKDGTSTADLPPIPVTIRSLLPAGRVEPHAPEPGTLPALGGYTTVATIAAVLWFAGLGVIVFAGRRRRAAARELARPATLADRLRPLVERAAQGALSSKERAQLELGLVAYWRRRLGLEALRPEVALARLREHGEAGPLLQSLEAWLHRPDPRGEVDVTHLLAPYRDLPPDEIEAFG